MFSDLRFALRTLRRNPGLIATAIFATALGVGANTAMFSVLRAVLLKPLPYQDPGRLVVLWEKNPAFSGFLAERLPVARRNFAEWRNRAQSFSSMAAVSFQNYALTGVEQPEDLSVGLVTPGFFEVFGRTPAEGRSFAAGEGAAGRDRIAIVSHAFRKRSHAVGQTVQINGNVYTIVGVLPEDFHMPAIFQGLEVNRPDVWLPVNPEPSGTSNDFERIYYVYARLRAGATLAQSRAEMTTLAKHLEREIPNLDTGFSASVSPLSVEDVGPETGRTVVALQVAVGFVLLIACANVANLLLARAAGRGRETAVRTALGASRGRLVRQALAESLILSLAGGAMGLFLADAAMRAIRGFAPKDNYHFHELSLDWKVLAFAAGAALASGVLFGILPAWSASRANLRDALSEGARSGVSRGARRVRSALVVGEVALAVILLAGAGLMLRSLGAMLGVNPGFNAERVLTAHVRLPQQRYANDEQVRAFCTELLDRVSQMGGVESAAIGGSLPMYDSLNVRTFRVLGDPPSKQGRETDVKQVSEDYFRATGTPILRGRGFTRQEAAAEKPGVVVINQALAALIAKSGDPLGRTLIFGSREEPLRVAVVGITTGVHVMGLDTPVRPEAILPNRSIRNLAVMLRTKGDPSLMANSLRAAVAAIDKDQPVSDVRSLAEHVHSTTEQRRFDTMLFGAFASLAMLLAAVGLYGVLSYSVALRTREIGVRMALGAQPGSVVRLVLTSGLGLALAGVLLGGAGALALTRLMSSLIFGISPSDPVTFVAISVVLAAVAALASYIPARRAARLDPIEALRVE